MEEKKLEFDDEGNALTETKTFNVRGHEITIKKLTAGDMLDIHNECFQIRGGSRNSNVDYDIDSKTLSFGMIRKSIVKSTFPENVNYETITKEVYDFIMNEINDFNDVTEKKN